MKLEIYYGVFLTACVDPQRAVAVFEYSDHATEWAKLNWSGQGWEVRLVAIDIQAVHPMVATEKKPSPTSPLRGNQS